MTPHLSILGTRGITARHGGFETFAERLSAWLTARGWRVTVYCQEEGSMPIHERTFAGARLVCVPVRQQGPRATMIFDWRSVLHASREQGVVLTLGYNTASFSAVLRARHVPHLINMDGIEWSRQKWNAAAKMWLWANERAGCWLADHLIADHPAIADHLATRASRSRITMIPYGADAITDAPEALLKLHGLKPQEYALVVARPEPENSIIEMVTAFSRRRRGKRLVLLGHYDDRKDYARSVRKAASDEVLFLGAIYDSLVVQALRFHCVLYLHGHTVGGTNPSLVEALGAGSAVLAHDNVFNRWVAGTGAPYFQNADDCANALDLLLDDPRTLRDMSRTSRERHV